MSRFPNKAGDHADTDEILRAELRAAGIPTMQEAEGKPPEYLADFFREISGEVKTSVIGLLYGWKFQRAWYYWICEGPGIEVNAAERLHAAHGRTVRVDGHAGCPSPREHFNGLACGSYHVDDADGLKALADTIRSLAMAKEGSGQPDELDPAVVRREPATTEQEVLQLLPGMTDEALLSCIKNAVSRSNGNAFVVRPPANA